VLSHEIHSEGVGKSPCLPRHSPQSDVHGIGVLDTKGHLERYGVISDHIRSYQPRGGGADRAWEGYLAISVSQQTPIVDIGAADDGDSVIHNHDLDTQLLLSNSTVPRGRGEQTLSCT
jgi:hypothetical protein